MTQIDDFIGFGQAVESITESGYELDFSEWAGSDIRTNYRGNRAHTLYPEDIGTHESGWCIEGEIQEDYTEWVNYFEAKHPEHGFVRGDFEGQVVASSREALEHFVEHHGPTEWDYWDI